MSSASLAHPRRDCKSHGGFYLRVGFVLLRNTIKLVVSALAILFGRIQSGEKTAGEYRDSARYSASSRRRFQVLWRDFCV